MTAERERAGEDRAEGQPETAPDGEAVSGFPEPPGPNDPGEQEGREPHHDLTNPVEDPDPTEWPDPYERRPDPRGPESSESDEDTGGETETPRSPSTSEPHPERNPDRERLERTSSKGASKRDRPSP